MTFTFDSLYQDYVSSTLEFAPYKTPSIDDFINESMAMVNSRLQDGEDPRPQDLFILEYASKQGLQSDK